MMVPLLAAVVYGCVSDHDDFDVHVCVPINPLSAGKSPAVIIGFLVSFVTLLLFASHILKLSCLRIICLEKFPDINVLILKLIT